MPVAEGARASELGSALEAELSDSVRVESRLGSVDSAVILAVSAALSGRLA